jgi:hypothetical protein
VRQIVPSDRLRLFPEWREKSEPRSLPLALERGNLQMIDGQHRLAEAPVTHHRAEPVPVHRRMNDRLQLPRFVGELDYHGFLMTIVNGPPSGPLTSTACVATPQRRSTR